MTDNVISAPTGVSFSQRLFIKYINWYSVSVLSFITVILFYQFLVVFLSYALGYHVEFHFGKVNTLPHLNAFWSGNRVMVIYTLPALIIMIGCSFFLIDLLPGVKTVTLWLWFRFWIMCFSLLLSTTLFTLSLFPVFTFSTGENYYFQGFSVVASWYSLSSLWAVLLLLVAIIINILAGYLISSVLFYISPSDFWTKSGRRYPRQIIFKAFLMTVVCLIPISTLLSYPHYYMFFLIMFLHAVFWLPGLLQISTEAILQRSIRVDETPAKPSYYLIAFVFILIMILLIFFA